MSDLLNSIRNLLLVLLFLLFINSICVAQNKVDLELKVRPSSETARGGETFSYTITVSNVGSAKATDVILVNEPSSSIDFISNATSKGNCRLEKPGLRNNLYCSLDDIDIGEIAIINVEVKIYDFGGESDTTLSDLPKNLPSSPNIDFGIQPNLLGSSIGDLRVRAEEIEENKDNNQAEIFVKLLPSKNIPPRVKILSPKSSAVITKQIKKLTEIQITIKAFDPDGKIEKVIVGDPQYSPLNYEVFEDNQRKVIFEGKTYTLEEVSENTEIAKLFERTAALTGKDTYTYILRNPRFGPNTIFISAVDDGGRIGIGSVYFDVTGDAAIEVVSPKKEQVFIPNSTITIETISKINDPALNQLRIDGTRNNYFYPNAASIPLLQQVSKVGNTFKHQYVWKNVEEGIYHLKIILFDGETPTNFGGITVIVAEPRVIKIFSLKNGQEFEEGKPIKISVNATDVKGREVYDELVLLVDGKYKNTVYNAWTNEPIPPYNRVIDKNYGNSLTELEKGTHTIQIIARQKDYLDEGAILGKSEIITIKVK